MHADPGGNLSKAFDLLKYLRDYDAIDTLGESKTSNWWSWIISASWKDILTGAVIILGTVLLLFMLLACGFNHFLVTN